jgi:Response regulator containing a CheY-like receiver domain and an HTH DNA-binding domain
MSATPLSMLNDCVLDLYANTQEISPDIYPTLVLNQLCKTLDIDKIWWGIMSSGNDGFTLHSSARHALPPSFESMWENFKHDDDLARTVAQVPHHTINFNEARFRRTPGLAQLMHEHEVRHALCTSAYLPDCKSFMFLSLYRCDRKHVFSADDVCANQLLMPHLFAAWNQNLRGNLRQRHQSEQPTPYYAYVDLQGKLIQYDEQFAALLAAQWPQWKPPSLPPALQNLLGQHKEGKYLLQGHLKLQVSNTAYLRLLTLQHASQLDRLSPRELEIASAFASGLSHKEIARTTGLTPATVRHYVRNLYAKLGVNDKGELATLYASLHR